MKKKIAFILVLSMLLVLAACGIASEEKETRSLYSHGLDIVDLLAEMTRTEGVIGIYTGNSEIKDIILALGANDYKEPDAVYAISVPEESLTGMSEMCNLEGTSDDLKTYLMQRVLVSVIS